MRLIDFFVFYEATLYKSKKEENRTGNQRLGKAIRIAGLIVAVWITTSVQLISFSILRRNIINIRTCAVIYFVIAVITILIFQNIYVTNNRYQYVISEQYRSFKMGRYKGIFIILFTLLASVALSVFVGVYMGNF